MISAEREETTVYARYLIVATHPQQHTDLDLVSLRKGSERKERGVSVVPPLVFEMWVCASQVCPSVSLPSLQAPPSSPLPFPIRILIPLFGSPCNNRRHTNPQPARRTHNRTMMQDAR